MQKIIIDACDVWNYFKQHKDELRTSVHIIAENEEYGISITLTEENGTPLFEVTADDYQCEEERVFTETECLNVAKRLYDEYLTGEFVKECADDSSLLEQEDMISERETELDDAIIQLLDAVIEDDSICVLQSNGIDLDDLCDDLKDHILEYLARKHKLASCIRRPMIMEDEDENEFFEEYPYECMIYEDEENPIYKPNSK